MKKKSIVKLIFVVPMILFFLLCFLFVSENKGWTNISLNFKKKEAENLIQKIEMFKAKNHYYPKKLSETGLPEPDESGPFFYDYIDSTSSYIVWFGWGLGESVIYDSRKKDWN